MQKKTKFIWFMLVFVSLTVSFGVASWASYTKEDKAIDRIGPEDARKLVESGQALLVCAYGDDACKSRLLEGAMLRSQLESQLASLSKDQKIIFYCG